MISKFEAAFIRFLVVGVVLNDRRCVQSLEVINICTAFGKNKISFLSKED
jgi:hypothetical protein